MCVRLNVSARIGRFAAVFALAFSKESERKMNLVRSDLLIANVYTCVCMSQIDNFYPTMPRTHTINAMARMGRFAAVSAGGFFVLQYDERKISEAKAICTRAHGLKVGTLFSTNRRARKGGVNNFLNL